MSFKLILFSIFYLSLSSILHAENDRFRMPASEGRLSVPISNTNQIFERVLQGCKKTSPKDVHSCLDKKLPRSKTVIKKGGKNFSTKGIETLYQKTPLGSACKNGNFSSGLSNWTGFRMKHSNAALPLEKSLSMVSPFIYNSCQNNNASAKTCLKITNASMDPVLSQSNINLKMAFSGKGLQMGGNGFSSVGRAAEGVSRKFKVSKNNAIYNFKYAIVMAKSHSGPAFFQAYAVDSNGNVVDTFEQVAEPANPFLNITSTKQYYRDWNCASLDLRSHIGKEVMVYFVNADCVQGGHRGHTYIDDVCAECKNPQEGKIEVTAIADECLRKGEVKKVSGTFVKPPQVQLLDFKIELRIIKNGVVKKTFYTPQLNGNNYSFSLSHSALAQLGLKDCYDIVVVMKYRVKGPAANTWYEVKSSKKDGIKAGKDNDICLNCRPVVTTPPDPINYDPCCAPINKERITRMLRRLSSTASSNYQLQIDPTSLDPDFDQDMQAYINLHGGINNHGANRLVTLIEIFDGPNFATANKIGKDYLCWDKKPNSNPSPCGSHTKNIPSSPLLATNKTYWIKIFTFIEAPGPKWITTYIPKKCDKDQVLKFNWGFGSARTTDNTTFNIMDSSGKILRKIPVK